MRMHSIMIQQWNIGGLASNLPSLMSRSERGAKLLARLQLQLCHNPLDRADLAISSKLLLSVSAQSLLHSSTFSLPRRKNHSSKHLLSGDFASTVASACRRLFSDFHFAAACGILESTIVYGSMTINGTRRRSSKMERPLNDRGYQQSSCFLPTPLTSSYAPLGFAGACAARILYCLVVQPDQQLPAWVIVKCRLFAPTDTKFLHYDIVHHSQPDKFIDLFLPLWCIGDLVSIAPHPNPVLRDGGWSVVIPI